MKQHLIRRLRVALLAAAALAVIPAAALAQGASGSGSGTGGTHGQRAAGKEQQDFNRKFQQLSDSLKLTEEQNPKMRSVMETEALKLRELKTKFKGTPDTPENRAELKKEVEDLRDQTHSQLVQILSPAQLAKMKKISDDAMRKKMKESEEKGEKKSDDSH
jgi:Spy/CpxP family protein refolding chaperone